MPTSLRLLVASPIDSEAIEALGADHDLRIAIGAPEAELADAVRDRQAVIFRSGVELSRELLDRAADLRLLVRAGSGIDNLDLDDVARRGIELHRVPGPGARAVAELTFALLLNLARQVRAADASLREGRWLKSTLVGHLLEGKTLGIFGLGNIGSTVARLGRQWGMDVIGCVDRPSPGRAAAFAAEGITLADGDAVLERADYLSIHTPLNSSTRGLIGGRELRLMRPTAYLVNAARGGIVDEMALRSALVEGRLAGAALDVHLAEGDGHVSPLADLPNVLLTPHIGASTVDTQREIGREVVKLIRDWEHDHPEVRPIPAGTLAQGGAALAAAQAAQAGQAR